jgi:acetyl-CoA carboxylase carboxyltransferase component
VGWLVTQPWQHRLDEIKARRTLAHGLGGPERIAREHALGSLTARESIAALADPGTFIEIGALAGSAIYDGEQMTQFTPADTVIGLCTVDGRKVAVSADDATVADRQTDTNAAYKAGYTQKLALEWKLPHVRLMNDVRGRTAYRHLGNHAAPGDPLDPAQSVAGDLPRPGDLPDGAGLQLPR